MSSLKNALSTFSESSRLVLFRHRLGLVVLVAHGNQAAAVPELAVITRIAEVRRQNLQFEEKWDELRRAKSEPRRIGAAGPRALLDERFQHRFLRIDADPRRRFRLKAPELLVDRQIRQPFDVRIRRMAREDEVHLSARREPRELGLQFLPRCAGLAGQ